MFPKVEIRIYYRKITVFLLHTKLPFSRRRKKTEQAVHYFIF